MNRFCLTKLHSFARLPVTIQYVAHNARTEEKCSQAKERRKMKKNNDGDERVRAGDGLQRSTICQRTHLAWTDRKMKWKPNIYFARYLSYSWAHSTYSFSLSRCVLCAALSHCSTKLILLSIRFMSIPIPYLTRSLICKSRLFSFATLSAV